MLDMDEATLRLELLAEPTRLDMKARRDFRIGIAATNLGNRTVDPELHRVRLFVDGRDVLAWNLAIANGRREARWFALPPGETVTASWSSFGDRLFPTPGDYVLMLRLNGIESAAVQIRVLP
jgi:hypothetical protein